MLKIFIADDSIMYRSQIEKKLALNPRVEVIGSSRISTGTSKVIANARPDLLIIDLETEYGSGFTLLELIHNDSEMNFPVLGLVTQSEHRIKAFSLGCRDLVDKSSDMGGHQLNAGLRVAETVAAFVDSMLSGRPAAKKEVAPRRNTLGLDTFEPSAVVIASSTGGPPVLEHLFKTIKDRVTIPVLITQHMPENFTKDLSERLARVSHNTVREAIDGEVVVPGITYVAPGNYHMRLVLDNKKVTIALDQGEKLHSVRPAADHLFKSAAEIYGSSCMGFVLTGMGSDGAEGARTIKECGGRIMLQDKESSAVWGMPGAAHALGAFDAIGSIEKIAGLFTHMATRKHG